MSISSFLSRVVPTAVAFATGGPVQAFATAASIEKAKSQEKKIKTRNNEIIAENARRQSQMADPYLSAYMPQTTPTAGVNSTINAGFGSGFGTFLQDVGRNILSPIGNIFGSPALQPFVSQQSRGQPAQPTLSSQRGQESSSSGTQDAFVGGLPNILGQAARFLRTTPGQIGTGIAVGAGSNIFGGQQSGMRITRKMKSQYRTVLNLAGGDYAMAADMIGVSQDMFIAVMLKRFRNDGPVVTKAALRKTKSTVRRLKSMCDMYDSLRPSATRRKAPMRRAATTLISNK